MTKAKNPIPPSKLEELGVAICTIRIHGFDKFLSRLAEPKKKSRRTQEGRKA